MILDLFLAPGGAAAAALLVFRVTGLMAIAPMLSARFLPLQLKAAITVLLVLLLLPAAVAGGGGGGAVTPSLLVTELVIGFALGFVAGVLIHAAEVAGDFIAVQVGLSGANLLDPLSDTQMPVLGQFMGIAVLTAFLIIGGHHVVVGALADSLAHAPPGEVRLDDGVRTLVEIGSLLFQLGLRMAAPIIAAVTIGNVALGILARTVPQMNVLMTAFPLQIGVGLLVLAATFPLLGHLVAGWPAEVRSLADHLFLEWMPDVVGGGS